MKKIFGILTRILRLKDFEYWIVDLPDLKDIVTKIIIWNDSENLNILTITSASKEFFISLEDLIVQIECLVSELQTDLEVCNLYEFLDLDAKKFPGYWDVDEDGDVYVEPYMQIEKEILNKIEFEFEDKYSFNFPRTS